ncbi:hypothetical protein [Glacieibacterium frigidum]|uniref:Uncharacterized protein n=1 Tax=Glacieibacterium frigidum TaxID=2593303 RepID=A0A552UA93_9SPHN|nr:hypothetical protein [Glacieibacterium frigidum]TRW15132.1 hypothetical protein FMM06_15935 [Glacieibacterium frigidum]
MIVSYETPALQQACFSLEVAEAEYGAVHAQALIALIADIEAFENVAELADFWGDELLVTIDDSLSLPIGAHYRASLAAVGTRYRRDAGGRVVLSSVTRLKLLAITGCQ